jgi:hypothetical protein
LVSGVTGFSPCLPGSIALGLRRGRTPWWRVYSREELWQSGGRERERGRERREREKREGGREKEEEREEGEHEEEEEK